MLVGRTRSGVVGGSAQLSQRAFGADGTSQNRIVSGFRGRPRYKSLDGRMVIFIKYFFLKMMKKTRSKNKVLP